MTVPVQNLSEAQRLWYATLVASAILADGKIDAAEIEFLKEVISVLKVADSKKAVLAFIASKQAPPLVPPPTAIPNQILAAIYIELIMVCISDSDFDQSEKDFLAEVSDLMAFTDEYKTKLNIWLEEGLAWKRQQQGMMPAESATSAGLVPVDRFSSEQKYWYASLMVSTILLDQQLDKFEVEFLKLAISFVETREEKIRLMGHVKNRMQPAVSPPPPGLEADVLLAVVFSVVQIVSSDESINFQEQTFLGHVLELCEIDPDLRQEILAWCHKGVSWRTNKNSLATRVRRKT